MNVREYLYKAKISQTAFAKKIGVSLFWMNQIYHRKKTPSLSNALKIVKETNTEVDFLDLLSEKDLEEFNKNI